jgi:hypothetical protein
MSEAQTVLGDELAEPVSIDLAESASIDRETFHYRLS